MWKITKLLTIALSLVLGRPLQVGATGIFGGQSQTTGVCDYVSGSGASIAASSTTLTAGSSVDRAAKGKAIEVYGAGANGLPLVTTVVGVSGAAVTLAAPASLASSSATAVAGPWLTVVVGGDGTHSYAVGDTLTVSGGTAAVATTAVVTRLQVVGTPTVQTAGTGGTAGTYNAIGTTGTGLKFIANITVSGGGITAVNSLVFGGSYSVAPTLASAEPVASDNNSFTIPTGAKLALPSMGVQAALVVLPGSYTVTPTNPVSTTDSGSGQGATLTMTFLAGGAYGYGTDNAAVLNAAPGNILLPVGTCAVGAAITYGSNRIINGQGVGITTLHLLAGANSSVLESASFQSLTGTNSAAGVADAHIGEMTIDGNAQGNYSPGALAGHGVALYGRQFFVHDLYIHNTYRSGLFTDYANAGGGTSPYDGHVWRVTTDTTGEHGWYNDVSDAHADDLNLRASGQAQTATFDGLSAALPIRGSNINIWGAAFSGVNFNRYGAFLAAGSKLTSVHLETAQVANLYAVGGSTSVSGLLSYNLPTVASGGGIPVAAMVAGSGNDIQGALTVVNGTTAAIGLRFGDYAGNTASGNIFNLYVSGFQDGIFDFSQDAGFNALYGSNSLSTGTVQVGTAATTDTSLNMGAGSIGYEKVKVSITGGFISQGATQLGAAGSHGTVVNGSYADGSCTWTAPSTGFTIAIGNTISCYGIKPAGTLSTGTFTLPTTPVDGQQVEVISSQTVTTLTVSPAAGQTLLNAPTTILAGTSFKYQYRVADTQWYRLY